MRVRGLGLAPSFNRYSSRTLTLLSHSEVMGFVVVKALRRDAFTIVFQVVCERTINHKLELTSLQLT